MATDSKKPGAQVVPRTSKVTENLAKSYGFAEATAADKARLAAIQAERGGYDQQISDFQKQLSSMRGTVKNKFGYGFSEEQQAQRSELEAQIKRLDTDRQRLLKEQGSLQSRIDDPMKRLSGTEQQMYKGAKFAEGLLGEEGLGRLGTDVEVQDTLQRFKDISEQGLSRQEVEAERAAAFQGIDRSTQTSQRALQAALARAGVKGATAGQQLLQGELGGLQAKAGVERDLFLKSEQLKREGLADYSQRLGDVKTFDIAQAASEKDIALQTGLAFAQMKSAKDIAAVQAQAQEAAARARSAAACFHEDVEVKMVTGKYKKISQIKLGEETSMGEVMGVSKYLVEGSELVEVNGNIMTNQHIIFHKGKYILAEEIGKKLNWSGSHVVYDVLIDGHHLLELGNDVLATDQEAMDYDAEAIKDFLNEFTTKVSTGTI